eukprot:jgi/Chrzof1/6117/Cz17g10120.t1
MLIALHKAALRPATVPSQVCCITCLVCCHCMLCSSSRHVVLLGHSHSTSRQEAAVMNTPADLKHLYKGMVLFSCSQALQKLHAVGYHLVSLVKDVQHANIDKRRQLWTCGQQGQPQDRLGW